MNRIFKHYDLATRETSGTVCTLLGYVCSGVRRLCI